MKNTLLILCLSTISIGVFANNVQVTNLVKTNNTITFDLSWENSWRSSLTYHDAVWIFVKQAANGGPSWQHALVNTASVGAGFETLLPTDQVGFFVRRAVNGNGTASTSVSATLTGLNGDFQDVKVMAIEMVYVPTGDFYAGDGSSQGRIARGDDNVESVHITSNNALTCGSSSNDIKYVGQSCTDIPMEFPKGYSKFYSMKYVITQRQYVDFLNCLGRSQQENRVIADVTGETVSNIFVMCNDTIPTKGNVIRCDATIGSGNITFYCDRNNNGIPNESDDGLSRSCNYLRIMDWTAYLDWSGLRPWTFLEIEKASRGPLLPIPEEQSWGSALLTDSGTLINEGTDTERWSNSTLDGGINPALDAAIRVGCNAPSSGANRELSNASFYGIIDIGNGPVDYYITPDYVTSFTNIEGDGNLNNLGNANVSSWPNYIAGDTQFIKVAISGFGISQMAIQSQYETPSAAGRGIRSNF